MVFALHETSIPIKQKKNKELHNLVLGYQVWGLTYNPNYIPTYAAFIATWDK